MTSINDKVVAVEELLNAEGVCAEVYQHQDLPIVAVIISWGDWKHDHARADYLVSSRLNGKKIAVDVTEENGSDCYSATHYYFFED